jgi:ankyrin repeat protein
MSSAPVPGQVIPFSIHSPAQGDVQPPAPQPAPAAPVLVTAVPADDPRGTKRPREATEVESGEPVLKAARTGPEVQLPDPQEKALVDAIERGDQQCVENLIRQTPDLLNRPLSCMPGGQTALCLSAYKGLRSTVELLLMRLGASVDAPAANGSTPLMFAAESGHVDLIHLLCLCGARPNAIHPNYGYPPLVYAIAKKHLSACQQLIVFGANPELGFQARNPKNGRKVETSPLIEAITADFSDLIGWLLDTQKLRMEWVDPKVKLSLLTLAIKNGARNVIEKLIARQANLDGPMEVGQGRSVNGIWAVAAHFQRLDVIEYLLNSGRRINTCGKGTVTLWQRLKKVGALSLYLHWPEPGHASAEGDGIKKELFRQQPEQFIIDFAKRINSTSFDDKKSALNESLEQGWLIEFIAAWGGSLEFSSAIKILSLTYPFHDPNESTGQLTAAQQVQLGVEFLSACLGKLPSNNLFSGQRLSPQTEQRMNRIAVAQAELLLKGIATLRANFEQQIASLPEICMNLHDLSSYQINEPELYRKLTKEWGLYDPIALAVLRLVKEAFESLRAQPPADATSSVAALSPTDQLKHAIADVLREWDKIPEIEQVMLEARDPEQVETVADLLFEQWRKLCEVFDVEKERFVSIGPKKRAGQETGREMENPDDIEEKILADKGPINA